MNTRDLEAFVAVVDTGSIVAAAARLHLTQPGITRRIQSLESALGAGLLDRQNKPLRPTPEGREAYRLGRRVLRSVADLRGQFQHGGQPSGELRLGVPQFLSQLMLAEPLDRLRAAYPALSLQVTTGWSPPMLRQLASRALDCAAVMAPEHTPAPDGLTVHVLRRYDTAVIAPLSFNVPEGPVALEDLGRMPWVLNQDGCGLRRAVGQALDRAGLPLHIAVESPTAELQMSLIERGLGLGLVTANQLARTTARVRRVEVRDFQPRAEVWLVHETDPGRLAEPIVLLRDTLAELLD